MQTQYRAWTLACLMTMSASAVAATAELTNTAKNASVELGRTVWFLGKVDGKGVYMNMAVNGIPGGNAVYGTINSQNGAYVAPATLPANPVITFTGTTTTKPALSATTTLTLRVPGTSTPPTNPPPTNPPPTNPPPTNPPPTTPPTNPGPGPIGEQPATDAATVAAARLLQQATFGPNAASIAAVKTSGSQAWLQQQFQLPLNPLPVTSDLDVLRRNWYMNMATAPDQLRQRMIFALSQIFVVSADKNPYGNEVQPWLSTIEKNAFGNYGTLLREMTLNPAMGKYLDLGNSVMPAPNENYAREVMQLFSIGPVMLNQDGSVQLDRNGDPLPSYDQATIVGMSRALSGWTYPGSSATGINWENFTGPLQPRDNYHDKGAKTIVGGLNLPAGQGTVQDYEAVMNALFNHPNLPPFVATRLIRAFVMSNPSPGYIQRVADVFASGPAGRGDLKATLTAVLTDPEAQTPSTSSGKLKDPMLHSLTLFRALNATVVDPNNMFWDYFLLGEKLLNAPSVFNFYSPGTPLPGHTGMVGPEFQLFAPAQAVSRANFLYNFLSGEYGGMVKIDITPFVNVAGDATTLLNLVDATLLQGRMTPSTRAAIGATINATADKKQRAITALYLTAITAEFAVQQ